MTNTDFFELHNTVLDSSPPSATYMRQIMACPLFGAKPLFKLKLVSK